MVFFFCAFVFMYVGRKIGWALSKPLYFSPLIGVLLFSLIWGSAVATSIRGLILWQQPGPILRWIMGYTLGAYVAIPNFGLLNEASVPPEATSRHVLLKSVPFLTYVVVSIALAFAIAAPPRAIVK